MTYADSGFCRPARRFFYHRREALSAKPAALRAGLSLLGNIKYGALEVVLPDGAVYRFKGIYQGPSASLHVHDDTVAQRFLTGGKLGFCESYLDGGWSSPDMAAFFTLILQNGDAMREALAGNTATRILSRFFHLLRPNSRHGAKKNIHHHYDIGNEFYAAWLDPSMTYSAGLFRDGNHDDLEKAQYAKYQEIIDRLHPGGGDHILEIGCGWGGFAAYAAQKTGCRVTALTISEAQYNYARRRIADAGLEHLVTIELCDYRDLTGTYDHIVSIEMFEAVGERYWPDYFNVLESSLKPGGQALLQVITIRDDLYAAYRRSADYIQRYIFPGGMLPSRAVLSMQARKAGLSAEKTVTFGPDYARTLALWHKKFQDAWPDLARNHGFDMRFKKMWEQYLCYCQAGFTAGTIDVIHIGLRKPV